MKYFNPARYMAVVPLIFGLTQCDVIEAIHNPKPKEGPYSFDLILKTSPKAEVTLKSAENLYVDAFYYGHAKPAFIGEADRLHRISLGREIFEYANSARRIHLYGSPLDAKKLSQTSEGEPQVLVSVDSTGLPGKAVTCRTFTGSIRLARQKPPVLFCELETESYWANEAASH
ncbi:hypothetical protein AEAC466_18315 [Asticcacaulis sp. AC466]|nr:hypothetical protein AEAC466_18315 [Asticcacaulis sp. AC466]